MSAQLIEVKTTGYRQGGTSLTGVTAMSMPLHNPEQCWIEGLGRGGIRLNGGLRIEATAMDELATAWLESRGKKVVSANEAFQLDTQRLFP